MNQPSRGGAVVLPDPPSQQATDLARYVNKLQPEIARALPKGMDADRVTRLALTLIRQSEMAAQKEGKPQNSLARCSMESFAGALLTASALGLEPGINGEAYLVPYGGECTLIVGYQGLSKLFLQHPLARYLDTQAVYANDAFDYAYGRDQFLTHKPALGERGELVAYWAAAEMANGAFRFVVLSPDEVKKLRGGKVGPSGKIQDPQRWMERKTALRQLLKLLPKSATLAAAIVVDEQRGSVLSSREVPKAIDAGDPLPALPPAPDQVPPQSQPPAPGPAPEPTGSAERITRAQLTKLHTQLTTLRVGADEKHAVVGLILGKPIESTKDISKAEATTLIDSLETICKDENPIAALDFWLTELREQAAAEPEGGE